MESKSPDRWRRFAVYHLPMIAYAALILGLSSVPSFKLPHLKIIGLDKVAHFVEYGIFAGLTFRSFAHMSLGVKLSRALLLALAFIVVFAFLDESLQSLIPGRRPDPADFLTDLAGALLVLLGSWLASRRTRPSVT
jgi:VanZ family protein